ncbi:MAG TPA: endonuclease domain-containing protein [Beijerinckiaceae bacterium]|nr:endonuclease domain-containing protein [Beijerinckiaceae bacterium]
MSIGRERAFRKRLTPEEAKLRVHLRALRPQGLHIRRQVPIASYVVDLACLKHWLVIELDGAQHLHHKPRAHDEERDFVLRKLGFRVLRFWNSEVHANIDGVIETVVARAHGTPPRSLRDRPSPEGSES